jgi:uncharacterized protein YdbL (DUF1318 family)
MKKRKWLIFSAALITCVFIFMTAGYAGNIKARFKKRLPEIVALKKKGVIGETNRGYLAFVKKAADKKEKSLVQAENSDRRTVYQAIAKQQGVAVEVVEKRRALQIAQKSPAGFWLQDRNGRWYRK